MMGLKEKFKAVLAVWATTFRTLRENPNILIPFLLVGLFDAIILVLIYLAPRQPFSTLLAPPIRAFWGEQYLHYPVNFLLIPRLFHYVHILSMGFIGVLMTGLAIGMVYQSRQGIRPIVLTNLIRSAKRYLSLVAIWLVIFGLVTLAFKGPQFLLHLKQPMMVQIALWGSFLAGILIEVVFIYAMPAVMIEKKRAWSAIKRSITFARSMFLATFLLVMLPTLLYIPLILLKGRLPTLMSRFFPEMVLIVLGLGIVVSVVIDCLVTCSATTLFLNKTNYLNPDAHR